MPNLQSGLSSDTSNEVEGQKLTCIVMANAYFSLDMELPLVSDEIWLL